MLLPEGMSRAWRAWYSVSSSPAWTGTTDWPWAWSRSYSDWSAALTVMVGPL